MPFALDCIDLLKDIVLNSSELQVFYPLIQCYSLVSQLGSEGTGELVWYQVQLKSSLPGSHDGWTGAAQYGFCNLHSECSHILPREVQNPGILSQWTSHASFVIEGMSTFSSHPPQHQVSKLTLRSPTSKNCFWDLLYTESYLLGLLLPA